MEVSFDQGEYEGSGDIHLSGVEGSRVFVNSVEYTAGSPIPIKIYRSVKDIDGDYWIEIDADTSDRHWQLVKLDPIRKDTLHDVAVKHGPLVTE